MQLVPTNIEGAYVIELKKFSDARGFFSRVWCKKTFAELGLNAEISQINSSFNEFTGTLRGMHYQKSPDQEVKVMQCIQGSIFDVIVDMRPDSATYLEWFGVELSQNDGQLLYVPQGCAHGYQTTSPGSSVLYPSSHFYVPESESGLRWDDPAIGIEWPLEPVGISEKDRSWPLVNK